MWFSHQELRPSAALLFATGLALATTLTFWLGLRASLDDASDKIGAKIRNAQLEKIPYMLVIGEKEAASGSVAVRHAKKGDLGVKAVEEMVRDLLLEAAARSL